MPDTAALTGESFPQSKLVDEEVLAGSINLANVIEVEVTKRFEDSSISRILDLVQHASSKKAKTELLIRRLAKIYTPIVVYIAMAVCFLPYFIVEDYSFTQWLDRALIFLVISCPCALVISIPLGYFGGLGAASKHGILFKGATFLDQITSVNTLVVDKTGTLTKGVFEIQEIHTENGLSDKALMDLVLAIENQSGHPIAQAILKYGHSDLIASDVIEIAGMGLVGNVQGKKVLVGNTKLLDKYAIPFPIQVQAIQQTVVLVAIDNNFEGYITLADTLKEDTKDFVSDLKNYGIKDLLILSGDKDSITQDLAKTLGVGQAKGGLLPEDKLNEVELLKQDSSRKIAFIGDGINDTPVLAASDIGIAMGGLGSDVAIETADVVIQTDQPSKFLTAIKIGKTTQGIIWQNIYLAFGVKILVLILGAFGMASMWEAVFADVGLALLAILNAIWIQRKSY